MEKFHHFGRFLQLFAEGTAGDTGVMAPDAGVQEGVKQRHCDVTAQAAQTGHQDREAEFQRLIRGEFKDLYDARVQDIVQKRLKGQQKTLEQYQSLEPALELLGKKYGVVGKDFAALTRAIRAEAEAKPDPQVQAVREENVQLKAQRRYEQWMQQTEEAKALYPNLRLEQEVQNPRFTRLLGMGLDVGEAYLLSHRDEILPALMRHSAKAVEEKLANHIAANGVRPPENGLGSQGAAVIRNDVSKMSRTQRQELIRRVQQGEIIRL